MTSNFSTRKLNKTEMNPTPARLLSRLKNNLNQTKPTQTYENDLELFSL